MDNENQTRNCLNLFNVIKPYLIKRLSLFYLLKHWLEELEGATSKTLH